MTSTYPGTVTAASNADVRGFVPATVSFVSVFAAGAAAIPLYDTYRSVDGLTNDEFSLAAVVYFVCAVLPCSSRAGSPTTMGAGPSRLPRSCSPSPAASPAGQASRVVSLPAITTGYAILAAVVWLSTLVAARNPRVESSSV